MAAVARSFIFTAVYDAAVSGPPSTVRSGTGGPLSLL